MQKEKQTPAQIARDYTMLTLATLLMCVGIYFFKFPNHFSTGGVSGISIILGHYAPNLSAGAFVFIINQSLLLLGFLVFGRSFGFRTTYVSLLMSCVIWGLEYICPMDAPLTNQPLLELIFAVTFPAIGSAIMFNMQASSGGTDIVAMIPNSFRITKESQLFVSTKKPPHLPKAAWGGFSLCVFQHRFITSAKKQMVSLSWATGMRSLALWISPRCSLDMGMPLKRYTCSLMGP